MSLENVYKSLAGLITQSINTFVSVLKILVQSGFGIQLPLAQSESCIVLANGPSLKLSLEQHPEFFKQHPLICVNTFALTPEFTSLKPAYYVILDPFFWEKENEAINETFKNLEEKTNWDLHLLIPNHAKNQKAFTRLRKNPHIKITPYNYTVFKGFAGWAHWFYKKNLAMPQSFNVTIAALFMGINMGYKKIYLTGADHTWHENLHMSEDNILHTKVAHFYENEVQVSYKPYFKGSDPQRGTQKAHEFFDIWSRTFKGYWNLKAYADYRRCTIYNASAISFIDAFERIKP